MATDTIVEKPPKRKRATRRNYAKELDKLQTYIETMQRIYSKDSTPSEFRLGQLDICADVLALIGGSK